MLYNLFEWPSRRNARLVVVGIANTIDLPERCLPRVSSRVTSRLTFGPYTKLQVGYRTALCGVGDPWNQCGTGMESTGWVVRGIIVEQEWIQLGGRSVESMWNQNGINRVGGVGSMHNRN